MVNSPLARLHSLTAFVVLLSSNVSLLYSAPVGVDDQIDNWDSRPSNPFSHWSPADQARQPWQATQSSIWLCSTVGTELPRFVHWFRRKVHLYTAFWTCIVIVSPNRKQKHSAGLQLLWETMADSPEEAKKIKERPGCFKYISTFTRIQVL